MKLLIIFYVFSLYCYCFDAAIWCMLDNILAYKSTNYQYHS